MRPQEGRVGPGQGLGVLGGHQEIGSGQEHSGRGVSRRPGCCYEDVLVTLDLLDFAAAEEDLQLAGSSFEGVEVQLDLDGVSCHQSPEAESKRACSALRSNCGR